MSSAEWGTIIYRGQSSQELESDPDEIPVEALKVDPEMLAEMLYGLFEKIWQEEKIPSEWKEGLLIKIPKKGDLGLCSNYRGITLLSVPGKVLNRVILERLKDFVFLCGIIFIAPLEFLGISYKCYKGSAKVCLLTFIIFHRVHFG